jgi:hypothetical protein
MHDSPLPPSSPSASPYPPPSLICRPAKILLPPGATLTMRPRLFRGRGAGKPGGPIVLARDVAVRGAAWDAPSGIDWGLMDAVIVVAAGRTLTLERLAVSNLR